MHSETIPHDPRVPLQHRNLLLLGDEEGALCLDYVHHPPGHVKVLVDGVNNLVNLKELD
jgi:hypothetical protein